MRVTTPKSKIAEFFEKRIQATEQLLVRNMCYVGERCVNTARSHTYRDQTGNLSSSIGYAVSIDGHVVQCSSFQVVLNGSEGAKDGLEYVRDVISKYPQGIVLVIVAGKNYAVYVSDKGYDVLDSAETLAETLVPRMMKQLGFNV
jgi:hypothetical protein